jgi:hypothetical protein
LQRVQITQQVLIDHSIPPYQVHSLLRQCYKSILANGAELTQLKGSFILKENKFIDVAIHVCDRYDNPAIVGRILSLELSSVDISAYISGKIEVIAFIHQNRTTITVHAIVNGQIVKAGENQSFD